MKANELRIGNFVQSLKEDGSLRMYYNVVKLQENGTINSGIINYLPIPIDEFWLIKFGFVKNLTGNWFILENKFTNISLNLDGVCDIGSNEEYTLPYKIQHVHQLQNLYFALTGEELKPTR